MRYITTIFTDEYVPAFNDKSEINSSHYDVLKWIADFIDSELMQLYLPNYPNKRLFHSYINLEGFPHIYASYVPILGNIEVRTYELYNMINLEELLYMLQISTEHK